jgi:hypothetical protein
MENTLKTDESDFPDLEKMLCRGDQVSTGDSPPDEAINFGSEEDIKYLTIEAFDDEDF